MDCYCGFFFHLFASCWCAVLGLLKSIRVKLILILAQILTYARLLYWQGITLSVVNSGV